MPWAQPEVSVFFLSLSSKSVSRFGANDDRLDVVVVVDRCDAVVGQQHVLIEQIADSEKIGMIADRHHRDDLAAVEEQGQRPLHDDRCLDLRTVMIDAGDGSGQPRIIGLGTDGEFFHRRMMGRGSRRFKRRHEMSNAVDSRAALLMSGENGCGAMTDLKTLYEEDTVAWAENQAAALRAAAQDGSNQELDWENLAEEIEDLSKSRRHELHSRIRTVVEHLVKLEYSPAQFEPRNGWRDSIQHARIEIEDVLLETSPSLKTRGLTATAPRARKRP